MFSRLLLAALLAPLLAVALSGCQKKEETVTPEVAVQAAPPRIGGISEQITADATLSPLAQAAIAPKVTAPVARFLVQRGARVKAGQLLAMLENSDLAAAAMDNEGAYAAAKAGYETATQGSIPEDFTKAQLDLNQAKAALDLSRSIVDARTQLFTQGAIPGRDLDTAKAALLQAQATYDIAKLHYDAAQKSGHQAALDSAKGQLDSAKGKMLGAQAQLGYTEIRSPIDGVVTDRPLFAGETAPAGTPLITVMDTSAMIAKVHVAQVLAQKLSLGAAAEVTVPGVDDAVDAKVSLISPALDPGSTTVEVWLRIENPKDVLKAGTPVHVSIIGRSADKALIVPAEAVQTAADGSKYVMVVTADSTARKTAVTLGIVTAKDAQILTGVTAKDNVITMGAYGLDEGTKVRVSVDGKDDRAAAGADK